jgi:hypothetical protein
METSENRKHKPFTIMEELSMESICKLLSIR